METCLPLTVPQEKPFFIQVKYAKVLGVQVQHCFLALEWYLSEGFAHVLHKPLMCSRCVR